MSLLIIIRATSYWYGTCRGPFVLYVTWFWDELTNVNIMVIISISQIKKGRYRAFNLNTQRGRNGRQSRGTRTFLGGKWLNFGSTACGFPVPPCHLRVWDSCSKLESIRALFPFLHRGLPLRLFAWFFPIRTKPLLSVLKKRRFTSQGDCKTSDKDNQPGWPGCLSWTL